MIHRAILGSLERFIAIITEHFGGKWCVFFRVFSNACVLRWAFRNAQAVLVVASPSARDSGRRPLCESCARSRTIPQQLTRTPFGACVRMQKEYAQEIADKLTALGLFADVDNGADTLPKKIRNGEIAQYNFLLGMFFFFRVPRHSADLIRHATSCHFQSWAKKNSTIGRSTSETGMTWAQRPRARWYRWTRSLPSWSRSSTRGISKIS